MLNPSRQLVITLVVVALVSLALGLATDVGLFGWSLASWSPYTSVSQGSPVSGVRAAQHEPHGQEEPLSDFVIEAYSSLTPSVSVSSPSSIVSKPYAR